ncbi:hypothetical protein CIW49_05240 [Mycolicibacterium sp. P1-18]|uniref:hypothetical protein n=1 Tax=Mycolicibacterium sp. P1-18 TaxID=2024615 RepID=UPI0011F2483C|nr:hypothetical protein [Mycolicibacterium sp. P1-18]KAA0100944.1 hypothetical protein CIW49_05240 [Mycolicibacterium sp. P1-18]
MTSHLPPRLGYVIECNGAWLRAQAVGVAMRLTVTGGVDAVNRRTVTEHLRRFVKLNTPLIVDVTEAHLGGEHGLDLVDDLQNVCAAAGVDWAMVADPSTVALLRTRGTADGLPLVGSTAEAIRHLNEAIRARQRRSPAAIRLSPPAERPQATTRNSRTIGSVGSGSVIPASAPDRR